MSAADNALVELGRELKSGGYRFTTITPLSHARVNARSAGGDGDNWSDVFGWNKRFAVSECAPRVLSLLERAGELRADGGAVRSGVRFSTLGEQIFAHSAFPTVEPDAVFFGPDTYRFARLLRQNILPGELSGKRVLDIGSGSGAGGLSLAADCGDKHSEIVLSDISPKALRFSRINTEINAVPRVEIVESDILASVSGELDLIICNPPYLLDPAGRIYRNGGGTFGFELSLKIVEQSLSRLSSTGRLILYTGAPVRRGEDLFYAALTRTLAKSGCRFQYDEIDPDVFGEELESPPYDQVDRIAVVVLTVAGRP